MQNSQRIMIVEDNPTNLMLLQQMVEHLGYEVVPAINGQVAIDHVFKGTPIDLVLMDLAMPGIDGLEASFRIRAHSRQTQSLPIIAVTASGHDHSRAQAAEAGLNDFLTKPVQLEHLADVLAGWLDGCPPVLDGLSRLGVPIFDAEILGQMLEDLDEETISILVEEFCAEIEQRLSDALAACDADDAYALRQTCHALKSSSGTFGAEQLTRLCKSIELAALEGRADDALDLAADIATVGFKTAETLMTRYAA
ncbi:MAG: hypothetical protein Alpg2KO_29720 [Alphaproteobacteria bacterium]